MNNHMMIQTKAKKRSRDALAYDVTDHSLTLRPQMLLSLSRSLFSYGTRAV